MPTAPLADTVVGFSGPSTTSLKSNLLIIGSLIIAAIAFFLWVAPWQVLACGPDEGMEFSKMLFLQRQPEAIKLAWNDQSWFYSQLFASLFTVTGFQCWIPRLVTLALTCGLLLAFIRLMPKGASWPHLVFAWLLFWCWPTMPHLAIAAMLELPAFGLAVIALALLPRQRLEWLSWRFFCAGILFAIAVQIKLTALVVLPALAAKMILLWWQEMRCHQAQTTLADSISRKGRWLNPVLGFGVFVVTYLLIAWWLPVWNGVEMWSSHVAAGATGQANKYRLEPVEFLQSPGLMTAAILGIIALWRLRRLGEAIVPLVLLASAVIIHSNHRPWWYYYGIHFAVPLAVLGGWGAITLLKAGMQKSLSFRVHLKPVFSPEISMMLGAWAISLWAGYEFSRGYQDTRLVGQGERIADNTAVNVLKQYQGRVSWAFSRNNMLVAQAGYLMPPEIMLVPKKRFWTGNINDQIILATVQKYQCEVLVLAAITELKTKEWTQFLENGYVKVWSNETESIFVANRLNPRPALKRDELFKQLGL